MTNPAEQLKPLEIRNEDDVWNALYIYGVKDSLGPVLDFYGYKTKEDIKKEEEKKEKENESLLVEHNPKTPQKNVRKIKEFFGSLVDEQVEEALMYLIGKKDSEGLIMFYGSYNRSIQRMIIEKMLFEAFETRNDKKFDETIHKLRKKLFMGNPPKDLDDAIDKALKDNPEKTILFLKDNLFQIPRFINNSPEEAVNSVLLEILKYIPKNS